MLLNLSIAAVAIIALAFARRLHDGLFGQLGVAVAVLFATTLLLLHLDVSPFHYETLAAHGNPLLEAQALCIAWWLTMARVLSLFVEIALCRSWFGRPEIHRARKLVADVAGVILFFGAICAVVSFVFNLPVSTLFATSGVFAIIMGLALQSVLSDFLAGVALNVESPYRLGEWVTIGPEDPGEIVETNWRSTHVRANNHDMLIIPNQVIAKQRLINHTRPTTLHRECLLIPIDESERPARVISVLVSAALSAKGVLVNPGPTVGIHHFEVGTIVYSVAFAIEDYALMAGIRARILSQIWEHCLWAGISRSKNTQVSGCGEPTSSARPLLRGSLIAVIDIFEPLSEDDRESIVKDAIRHRYAAGEAIVEEGAAGDSMFIVAEGAIAVTARAPNGVTAEVARLGAGEYFGEMSLLTGAFRSATVRALTEMVVYEITKARFAPLIEQRPAAVEALARVLAARADVLNDFRTRNAGITRIGVLAGIVQTMRSFFGVRSVSDAAW